MSTASSAPSRAAFFTLLFTACLFGANHVAARLAFNHGLDVASAVTVRSLITALVVGLIVWQQRVSLTVTKRQRGFLLLISGLVAVQSLSLYAAVARLPVALALLTFNTYPLWTALFAWLFYRHKPERAVLLAMPVLLIGLALALDVFGAASGLGAAGQWNRIGAGVAFAMLAAAVFGAALVCTQHEAASVDGRLRTTVTMALVGLLALLVLPLQGGLHLPQAAAGWWGLAGLTLCYGTAFTIMFTLLPKLGVVGSSPIMNVEPVAALVLAWALLGQSIAPVQVTGALIVVGAVMALGLRKR
ncbi:MAG: DMT family transporter [Hylemonella sp.]|uniref:DMT family transporter n=1 Tax=Hylemonella sp. TaxID=2066020 RepID=UPI0022C7B7AD|nr:DMT family transporter [Hylemonella sp.]MCZ8252755.1 DMT family transporter [Hylemonella sp.]